MAPEILSEEGVVELLVEVANEMALGGSVPMEMDTLVVVIVSTVPLYSIKRQSLWIRIG